MPCKLIKKTCEIETCLHKNLCKLFSKNPKCLENRISDNQKAKESIIMKIKSCIQSWCDKLGVTTSSFSEWKQAVISALDEKFSLYLFIKVTTEKSQLSFYKSNNRKNKASR